MNLPFLATRDTESSYLATLRLIAFCGMMWQSSSLLLLNSMSGGVVADERGASED
jgi:hypothetical protein